MVCQCHWCSVINLIILHHSYTTSELSLLSRCLTFDLIRIASFSRKPTGPISLREKALYLGLILPWLIAVINKANFGLSSSPGNKQIRFKKSADIKSLNPCNGANECPWRYDIDKKFHLFLLVPLTMVSLILTLPWQGPERAIFQANDLLVAESEAGAVWKELAL